MAYDDMDHLPHLPAIAASDVSVLRAKEETYQGSWKRAGGRSAWFMARRNMDRLITMMERIEFRVAPDRIPLKPGDTITLDDKEFEQLLKSMRSEDIFSMISASPSGKDGTVLACLRDLRRYFMLVEAEMVAEGVVEPEGSAGGEAPVAPLQEEVGSTYPTCTEIQAAIWRMATDPAGSTASPDALAQGRGFQSSADGRFYFCGVDLVRRFVDDRLFSPRWDDIATAVQGLGGAQEVVYVDGKEYQTFYVPMAAALHGGSPIPEDLGQMAVRYEAGSSLASADYSGIEARAAALQQGTGATASYREQIAMMIAHVCPGLKREDYDTCLEKALASQGTDLYSVVATATGVDRATVKNRCFYVMYQGTGSPTGRLASETKSPEQVMQEYNDSQEAMSKWYAETGPVSKYEDRILRLVAGASAQEGSGDALPLAARAAQIRPGGNVYGRVAEAGGNPWTTDEVRKAVLEKVYAAPNEDRTSAPPLELHESIARAVSHAVNYEGIDAALNTADHILAELLTIRIVQWMEGRTDGQLLDAGWTFGPHGVPIPPPSPAPAPPGPTEAVPAAPPLDDPRETGTATQPIPNTWCLNIDWLIDYAIQRCYEQTWARVRVQLVTSPDEIRTLTCEKVAGEERIRAWITGPDNLIPLTKGALSEKIISWQPPADSTILGWSGEPTVPGTPADGGHHDAPADTSPQVPRPGPAASHNIDALLAKVDTALDQGYKLAFSGTMVGSADVVHDLTVGRMPVTGKYHVQGQWPNGVHWTNLLEQDQFLAQVTSWWPESVSTIEGA